MQTLIVKIRNLINDFGKQISEIYYYKGSNCFPVLFPIKEIVNVKINGLNSAEGNFSYNLDENVNEIEIIFESGYEFNTDDMVEIIYKRYRFANEELKAIIEATFSYLSINNYTTFKEESGETITPDPSDKEYNLIAVCANVLLSDNYRQIRLANGIVKTYPNEKTKREIIADLIWIFRGNSDLFGTLNLEE